MAKRIETTKRATDPAGKYDSEVVHLVRVITTGEQIGSGPANAGHAHAYGIWSAEQISVHVWARRERLKI